MQSPAKKVGEISQPVLIRLRKDANVLSQRPTRVAFRYREKQINVLIELERKLCHIGAPQVMNLKYRTSHF